MNRYGQRLRALESRIRAVDEVQFVRVTHQIEPEEKGTDPSTWPVTTTVMATRNGVALTDAELEALAADATPEEIEWLESLSNAELRLALDELIGLEELDAKNGGAHGEV